MSTTNIAFICLMKKDLSFILKTVIKNSLLTYLDLKTLDCYYIATETLQKVQQIFFPTG
jgi:hypothetical protein